MKTEKEINDDILKITNLIYEKFPELVKYISEMPITMPNKVTPEINIKILQDYYNSLAVLMKDYEENHPIATK